MSSAGTSAVAAMSIRSEKRLVADLVRQGATSPETAIPMAPGRLIVRGALRRLIRNEAVHRTVDDRLWVDADAYDRFREKRRGRIFLSIFGIAALLIILAGAIARFG